MPDADPPPANAGFRQPGANLVDPRRTPVGPPSDPRRIYQNGIYRSAIDRRHIYRIDICRFGIT
jgi:hypothetical protein